MLNLIRNELYKAIRLKKLYIFMLVTVAIEIAAIIQIKYNPVYTGASIINGQSFPMQLFNNFLYFIMIFISVFISDIWIDEYKSGTLKLALMRPVSRISLLHSKIISFCICTIALIAFEIVSAYAIGTAAFGWGEITVINGIKYLPLAGIYITLQAAVFTLFPILGFSLLVMFFALWTSNIGVTVGGTMGLIIISQIIETSERIREYSIIYLIRSFYKYFFSGFSNNTFLINLIVIAAYVIFFYIGSLLIFRKKDIVV